MSALFGCICNQPELLIEALEPVRDVLIAEAPVSRWGLGYIHSDEVLLNRTPRRSEKDVDFYEVLKRVRSDHIVVHAADDDGLYGNENTQPFRYRRWLFAQEGALSGTVPVQPRLLERIPEYLRRSLGGKTVAEHVFYTFLSVLHDRNAIDDVNIAPADARDVLAATVARVEEQMNEAAIDGPMGNLIACNSRTLMAVRLDRPLYMRGLVVPRVKRPSSRTPTAFRGVLVVSANEHPGEGFEEIPPRSALLLPRDVRPEVVSLHS